MKHYLFLYALFLTVLISAEQVGNTSWDSPPFLEDIADSVWGSSQGQAPQMMFWEAVDAFPDNIHTIRNVAAGIEDSGKIGFAGLQRWQGTYQSSLPGGSEADLPGHQAWVNWIQDGREDLLDRSRDNLYMPGTSNPDESWGHISMWTPMNSSEIDIPISSDSCFADWIAYKIGTLLGYEHVRGLLLSDFFDSHPHVGTNTHDFNPRIVDDFVSRTGNDVPSGSVSERAQYILDNCFNEWTDYINERFAYYLSALVREIRAHNVTGKEPLILCQNGRAVSMLRFLGLDARFMLEKISSDNLIAQWDVQNMLRVAKPPTWSAASAGVGAARAPGMRYGFTIDSDHESKFWNFIDDRFPELDPADYDDFGWGWLKRVWMEVGWVHIATEEGTTRRAGCFFLRNNQDAGNVPEEWISLIRNVVPTRPYGPALYYSVAIERYWENKNQTMSNAYMRDNKPVYDLRDAGVPFACYVSDAGLENMTAENSPSAWILVDHYDGGTDLLPTSEKNALHALAPIIDEDDALSASYPISFSGNVDGFAFYDQNDRLIVVAGNELDPAAGAVTTTVTLDLSSGTYQAVDLISGEIITFTSNGTGSFNLYLPAWECRAMAITTLGSGGPPIGNTISLKGPNYNYVSSEDGQSVMNCNRSSGGNWEKFTVVDAGNGKIALKGNNGKYVCSENGTKAMICDRSYVGGWETFTWIENGDGTVSLKGNNGKYVNDGSPMWCNSSNPTDFTVDVFLIANGGFEVDSDNDSYPDDWGTAEYVSGSPIFSHVQNSNVAYSGNSCVSIEITEPSGGSVDWRLDNLDTILGKYKGSDVITLSFMYKTSGIVGANNETGFIARLRDSSGNVITDKSWTVSGIGAAADWTYFEKKIMISDLPASTAGFDPLRVIMRSAGDNFTGGEKIWFDDVSLTISSDIYTEPI